MKKNDEKDYYEAAGKIIIFRYLKPDEMKKIIAISRFLHFKKGEKISAKGDLSQSLCAVLQGTVNVAVPEENGGSVFISSIGAGDVFGEAGIFLRVMRTADVVSADASVIQMIGREDMIGFIKSHPEAGIKILMLIIYSLLKKLKEANLELAFERKADINQSDIDTMVEEIMKE
jgi:CRP-like cAMP-binding protein